jgi:hypothetical protein
MQIKPNGKQSHCSATTIFRPVGTAPSSLSELRAWRTRSPRALPAIPARASTGDLNRDTAFSPFTSPVFTNPLGRIQLENTRRFQIQCVSGNLFGRRRKSSLCDRHEKVPGLRMREEGAGTASGYVRRRASIRAQRRQRTARRRGHSAGGSRTVA